MINFKGVQKIFMIISFKWIWFMFFNVTWFPLTFLIGSIVFHLWFCFFQPSFTKISWQIGGRGGSEMGTFVWEQWWLTIYSHGWNACMICFGWAKNTLFWITWAPGFIFLRQENMKVLDLCFFVVCSRSSDYRTIFSTVEAATSELTDASTSTSCKSIPLRLHPIYRHLNPSGIDRLERGNHFRIPWVGFSRLCFW